MPSFAAYREQETELREDIVEEQEYLRKHRGTERGAAAGGLNAHYSTQSRSFVHAQPAGVIPPPAALGGPFSGSFAAGIAGAKTANGNGAVPPSPLVREVDLRRVWKHMVSV